MKNYSILSIPAALMFVATSCAVDQGSDYPADGRQVQIAVAASTTRADEDRTAGDPKDREISTLSVPGYAVSGGKKIFDEPVDFTASDDGGRGTIWAKTGKHNMFFIANAAGITVPEEQYRLRDVTVPQSAFSSELDIPMFAQIEDVMITALSDVPDPSKGDRLPGKTDKGEPLGVVMTRLGIRLDITLTLDAERFGEWFINGVAPAIVFGNLPEGVNLLPGKDNPGDGSVSIPVDKETAFTSDGDKRTITIERIILPELLLSGDNNIKEKGLTMTVAAGSWSVSGVIAPSAGDYSIPRNTYLAIAAEAKDKVFDFNIELADWTEKDLPYGL